MIKVNHLCELVPWWLKTNRQSYGWGAGLSRVCLCLGLRGSGPPCKKTPTSSWTLGNRTGLHVENTDPTDSLSPHHTHKHTELCASSPTLVWPWLVLTPAVTDSVMFTGSPETSPGRVPLPTFKFVFSNQHLLQFICAPTTSQQDLLCPNLKRVSQFPKVKCLRCLEECKRIVVEIIQEEIAAISYSKCFHWSAVGSLSWLARKTLKLIFLPLGSCSRPSTGVVNLNPLFNYCSRNGSWSEQYHVLPPWEGNNSGLVEFTAFSECMLS